MINGATTYTANEIKNVYNGTRATFEKCIELEKQGYVFIPGNNPYMYRAAKWQNYDLVRVAQTNSRYHGRPIQTLWAVKSGKGK